MRYVLEVSRLDGFVYRVDNRWMFVSITEDRSTAKRFKTVAAAEKFASEYTNIGYGLVTGDCKVVEL